MKRVIVRTLQIVLPLFVIGIAAFAALTMIRNRPQVEIQAPVFTPPGVRVHEVRLNEVPMSVSSQGTIRPRTESQLMPEIAGRVTWVSPSFAEGGFFEVDDVLVKIDPFDYEQALVSARSQLAQARLLLAQEVAEAEVAEREWNDLGRGNPRELTLRKPQLDDAEASVAAAEANVVRAERDLERADIVAPYAGRVRQKNVDIGQFVRLGDSIATVYSVDTAEVRLPLPDDQIAYLDLPLSYRGSDPQSQPRVTLRSTFAGETHEWQGRIVRTESEIDPVSRMVYVVAEVADPYAPSINRNQPPLAVGMYVEAEIEGRTVQDVAVVPRAALRGLGQVFVVSADERLAFRNVDVFRATTDAVFVHAGLLEGDLVVISPLDTPTDGMQVQLVDVDPELLSRHRGRTVDSTGTTAPASTEAPAEMVEASTPDNALSRDTDVRIAQEDAPLDTAAAAEPPSNPAWLAALTADRTPERSGLETLEEATTELATPPIEVNKVERRETDTTTSTPVGTVTRAPTTPASPTNNSNAPPNAVAVIPFSNLNLDESNLELGGTLSRAVSDRLQAVDGVTITSQQSDARYIISGGVQQVGPSVRVTVRIVDSINGSVLQALKVDGSTDARENLKSEVVTAIAEHVNIFRDVGSNAQPSAQISEQIDLPEGLAEWLQLGAPTELDFDKEAGSGTWWPDPTQARPGKLWNETGLQHPAGIPDEAYSWKTGTPIDPNQEMELNDLQSALVRFSEYSKGFAGGTNIQRWQQQYNEQVATYNRRAQTLEEEHRLRKEVEAASQRASSHTQVLTILPFDELTASSKLERNGNVNLSDALTNALTSRLADLPSVAISSSEDTAAWLVDGSIQQIGDVVRVTAHLVDVASGTVLRAFKIDGNANELGTLQENVTSAIAASVREMIADKIATANIVGLNDLSSNVARNQS